MKGLTDEERDLMSKVGPCNCAHRGVPPSMGRDALVVAIRLQARGLVEGYRCDIKPLPTMHAIVTPLGRVAIAADAAARGLLVLT